MVKLQQVRYKMRLGEVHLIFIQLFGVGPYGY